MEQSSKPTPVHDLNADTEGTQVFLETAAITSLSQHNPDRDKKLRPSENQHLHITSGQTKFAQKFRFGAYGEITLNVNTLQNCPGNSQSVFHFFSASEADDDEAPYQSYRHRALVSGGIHPHVNALITCPGNSQSVSQSFPASEADEDEAEYQYYRQRALVRPHEPLLDQNISDTRGSPGLAPFSPPGILGGSANASYAFVSASTSVQLDFAPATFAPGFRFGAQAPLPPALNSSQSCFGANFLSRFPLSNLSGFQLGTTSAQALNSTPPAAFQFGANQNSLSSSHPHHSAADAVERKSTSDSSIYGHRSSWTAQLCCFGHEEETFFQNQRLSPDVIDTTWSAPSLVDLIEKIGLTLRIHDLAPIGMAHQFEQQRDAARRSMCRADGFAVSSLRSRLHWATQPCQHAFPSLNFAFVRPLFYRRLNARRCLRFLKTPSPESPRST